MSGGPYLVPLLRFSASNNGVTLKSWLGVVQGHWQWCQTKPRVWFPIRIP